MGSPPFETGKVAGDASSQFVTEEQQTPAAFIVDSERTFQKSKKTRKFQVFCCLVLPLLKLERSPAMLPRSL